MLGDRLKALRLGRAPEWTQEKVVEELRAGLRRVAKPPTRATYGSWERGASFPNAAQLAALADLFEVNADYLLGRTEVVESLPCAPSDVHGDGGIRWHLACVSLTAKDKEATATFDAVVAQRKSADELAWARRQRPEEIVAQIEMALDHGLVELDVLPRNAAFERRLTEELGLREAIVLELGQVAPEFRKLFVGEEAANLFAGTVQSGYRASISGGTSTARMAMSLAHRPLGAIELYAMDANPIGAQADVAANTLIGIIKLTHPGSRIRVHGLHDVEWLADPLSHTSWARQARHVLWQAGQPDAAFLGIGSVSTSRQRSTIHQRLETEGVDITKLIEGKPVVADVLFHLIDADGQPIEVGFESRITSVSLDALRQLAESAVPVVALLVGVEKAEALVAASRGKFINRVICDSELAARALGLPQARAITPPVQDSRATRRRR